MDSGLSSNAEISNDGHAFAFSIVASWGGGRADPVCNSKGYVAPLQAMSLALMKLLAKSL